MHSVHVWMYIGCMSTYTRSCLIILAVFAALLALAPKHATQAQFKPAEPYQPHEPALTFDDGWNAALDQHKRSLVGTCVLSLVKPDGTSWPVLTVANGIKDPKGVCEAIARGWNIAEAGINFHVCTCQ